MNSRMRPASAGRSAEPAFDWPKLVADKEKEISRALEDLSRQSRKSRRRDRREPRRNRRGRIRCSCSPTARDRARATYPGRDRRRARAGAGDSRHRACDHLERGLRSARNFRSRLVIVGRRLYRGRIRQHLRAARRAGDARLSRRTISCAASTRICASLCAMPWSQPASPSYSALLPTRIDKTADGFTVALTDGASAQRRSGDARDRPRAARPRIWASTRRRRARSRSARSRSTNIRNQRCRRSMRSATSRTASTLTPVAIREGHAFADTVFGGKTTAVDHDAMCRPRYSPTPEIGTVGPDRGAGARSGSLRRYLRGQFPADEGDAVGPRRKAC